MTKPHPLEPSTTLPYIHCPHCGMLIIGVVKIDNTSDKVLDEFVEWDKSLYVWLRIEEYKKFLKQEKP